MPRILVIKTSSLGDLVHCQTALQEAHWNEPELVVDWVSERGLLPFQRAAHGLIGSTPWHFGAGESRSSPARRESRCALPSMPLRSALTNW